MPQQKKSPETADYARMGRVVEQAIETGYFNRWQLLKINFLKGLAAGVGGVIGATIVVAILLWLFAQLDQVPLVGPVFDGLERTVESQQK